MEKIKELLKDKKKRYLVTILCIVPFLVAILLFSISAINDVKDIIKLTQSPEATISENKHYISSMNYLIRDNATDYQVELFNELKDACEANTDPIAITSAVVKNYIADFYTWTNKAGQYDVGGMYFVYHDQDDLIYIQARDGIYKYINEYIEEFGSDQLLEVESVTATSVKSNEHWTIDGVDYEAWNVTASWKYVEGKKFSTNNFATKMNFIVIYNTNSSKYEIIVATTEALDSIEA